MKILLTNDDGYQAPGIQALFKQLCPNHDVTLVAPDKERSAVGQGITLHHPLRIATIFGSIDTKNPHSPSPCREYAVSGTPADCIKLSLDQLFDTPPDLVISGINAGSNTGVNIHYSGTVGAAREAVINGIPSIAVSIQRGDTMDFQGVAKFIDTFTANPVVQNLPMGTFLNINAPAMEIKQIQGAKVTRQATNNVSKRFEKKQDPRDGTYYWYDKMDFVPDEPDTDNAALSAHYISITPIQCDITNHTVMKELQSVHFLQ